MVAFFFLLLMVSFPIGPEVFQEEVVLVSPLAALVETSIPSYYIFLIPPHCLPLPFPPFPETIGLTDVSSFFLILC